ncbi:pyruvate formate-lyase-activating protein [Anaeromicropila populeti]|uniref:Pyruvate formate-lyase-activating enzyme n=1 Tax=Anaeromicropila populeti TaxID=37658 RepID=A0A1I6HMT8_9FIRM|nr:pyruvate formate-lyase-activating protein [Anaeromicropila populeti]SFR55708.1 pyruvate formate lyase activating enzyme [Anaeromicropila populeti]
MLGQIHSIETMGLVDGPGIRSVVFLQGCLLRCCFCHNPDTWSLKDGKAVSPEELVKKLIRFRPYFEKSGGGVTFSGGEPLLQPGFLEEVLFRLRNEGIHTAIDTAGVGARECNYGKVLKYTDLVLFDVKHYTSEGYKRITGRDIGETTRFIEALNASQCKVWIRHVVIPDLTDSREHLVELKNYISQISNVEKVELLPYHLLGVNKYKVMDIPYPLEGVAAMNVEKTKQLQLELFHMWK